MPKIKRFDYSDCILPLNFYQELFESEHCVPDISQIKRTLSNSVVSKSVLKSVLSQPVVSQPAVSKSVVSKCVVSKLGLGSTRKHKTKKVLLPSDRVLRKKN